MKSKEIELSIIGNILTDTIPYQYILQNIRPDYFTHYETKEIISTMLTLLIEKGKVDVIMLLNEFRKNGYDVEKYRGIINEAIDISSYNYNYDEYLLILKNRYINNKFKTVLKKYYNKSEDDSDVITLINMLNTELLDIEKNIDINFIEDTNIKFDEFEKILVNRREQKYDMFTGFNNLDKLLGTNNYGELIIIAGRPGLGKTTFALNIILNFVNNNKNVSLFTIEMSYVSIIERLLSINTNIPNFLIQNGKYSVEELVELKKAIDKIKGRVLINDKTNTIEDIINIIIRQKMQYSIKNYFIDYLQLLSTEKRGYNKNDEIGYITRSLAITAKKYDVNIFLISQLNRNLEHREDKTPTLADLRDSGSIEADAHKILFLYCKDKNYENQEWDINILVAKNRNGDVGKTDFLFKRNILKFEDKNE